MEHYKVGNQSSGFEGGSLRAYQAYTGRPSAIIPSPASARPIPSVFADMDGAQILRMEGRDQEAQELAERAYTFLASQVEATTTRGDEWKEGVLTAAQAAALAGNPDEAGRLRALADEQEHPFFWIEARAKVAKGFLDAYLGDPESGWERLEPWADDPSVFATRAYLTVAPHVQHLFGEVARFQEFITGEN